MATFKFRGIIFLILITTLTFLISSQKSYADTLQVTSNITPQEMVQQVLIGGGVQTSNITFTGANVSRGKFWGGPGNIGVTDGLILTSGNATYAIGPNNVGNKSQSNNQPGDPDLTAIAGVNTNDACVLEFDFVPQSSTVSFNYVFGSEEYHEFVFSYNDAFGFFISGPGITGPYSNNSKNIALIPLTNIPVTINNVNCGTTGHCDSTTCHHCQFFVSNTQNFTQYDAFTTVLTAWATVIPCETYHIKLAIGDGSDFAYDSGVFLEAGSFTSLGVNTTIDYTHEQSADFAIEGCNNATVQFTLSDLPDEDFWLPLTITGSATNGVDYVEIPDSIFFPQGYSQEQIQIIPIEDHIPEWIENVNLIYNSSVCSINLDTVSIQIRDYKKLTITTTPDTTINCATTANIGVLDLGGFGPYSLIWSTGDTSDFITVSPLITTTYYITVIALCDSTATDSITVHVNGPSSNAGIDQSIPYGTNTILEGSASQGSGDYTYYWEPSDLVDDPTSPTPTTNLLESTTVFTLTVTDQAGGCQDADEVIVHITGGPLAANPIATPNVICNGDFSTLIAYPSGGSEDYSYSWTSNPPGFTSDLPEPVVYPTDTTTYYLTLDDGYHTVSGNTTVNVLPLPVPNAGLDDTIPNGISTQLFGSASLGSGNYSYHWEPAISLVNPVAQNPMTKNLYSTTLFRLTVTDNETGCVGDGEDQVKVVVTGGPLTVSAEATKPLICYGDTTQLIALGTGGYEGHYKYYWSTIPPSSWSDSTTSEPYVSPLNNTTYKVTIKDGYNIYESTVDVQVSPLPVVNLGGDTLVCPYDSVTISAGNPGMSYYWFNGSQAQSVKVGTTGIGFDQKKVWVRVENEHGCYGYDSINVIFDFAKCTGIDENSDNVKVMIFPNPTSGIFKIVVQGMENKTELQLTDMQGQIIMDLKDQTPVNRIYEKMIDLSAHPRGIYLLKLVNQQNVIVKKLILK